MSSHASAKLRLSIAALLLAAVAGCGGHSGTDPVAVPIPAQPPAPPPPPYSFGVFPSAAVVLGQANFDDSGFDDTLETLDFPTAASVASDGRLVVVDARNDKLKVYSDYDATPAGRAADFAIDLNAEAISTSGSKFVVVEGQQVKIFDAPPRTGEPLGQPIAVAGTVAGGCNSGALGGPEAAFITPQGRLVVADSGNHRILIWNSVPAATPLGPAHIVLGQVNMDTCLTNGGRTDAEGLVGNVFSRPISVWSDDKRLLVSDHDNGRVLIWQTFPTTNRSADHVVGKASLTDDGNDPNSSRPSSLDSPWSLDVNERGQLAVADKGNHRVLIWDAIPVVDGKEADQVIGQPDLLARGSQPIGASTVFNPRGVHFHKRNLIVAEPETNRVLVWRPLD